MAKPAGPWKIVNSRVVHRTPLLTLYEDTVITPSGKPGTYTYTESPPFILIIAYDGKHFMLQRQYRYLLKRGMIELPGDAIDPGETPLAATQRELHEETGLAAEHWTQLGIIDAPNRATIFLAENLTDTGDNEMYEEGIEKSLRLTRTEINDLIARSELTDAKTLAALLLFDRYSAG